MTNDKLPLSDNETEFLMIGTKQQLTSVSIDHSLIGDCEIRPTGAFKNLGMWLDSHLLRNSSVNNTYSKGFYYLLVTLA